MAIRAGMATMTSRSRIMPMVSISTTEPRSTLSVSGMTTGEASVSSRTMDRHSEALPPHMPTHIKDAMPVGMAYSSTSPVVNRGASGNSRPPSASVSTGITI